MPIVSRSLRKLANWDDVGPGLKRWRVDGVDGRGDNWVHGPFTANLSDAESIRDSAWPQAQLNDHEENLAHDFIQRGGDPALFVRQDLTLVQYRRRLAKRFWKATIEDDRNFLCRIAPFIASFTATQISKVLGISGVRAQKGIDKAVDLRDNVCPAMQAVDDEAKEI